MITEHRLERVSHHTRTHTDPYPCPPQVPLSLHQIMVMLRLQRSYDATYHVLTAGLSHRWAVVVCFETRAVPL